MRSNDTDREALQTCLCELSQVLVSIRDASHAQGRIPMPGLQELQDALHRFERWVK